MADTRWAARTTRQEPQGRALFAARRDVAASEFVERLGGAMKAFPPAVVAMVALPRGNPPLHSSCTSPDCL